MVRVTMIDLPDGYSPGSAKAIKAFAKLLVELKKKHPGVKFELVPFSYSKLPGSNQSHLVSMMAIAL